MGADAFSDGLDLVPVLNAASAITLMDESEDLYIEIAQAYMNELAELTASLESALVKTDLTGAARTLHTFKGLSLTVGAQRLSEVCKRCELLIKTLQAESRALSSEARAAMITGLHENALQACEALDVDLKQRAQLTKQAIAHPPSAQQRRTILDELQDLQQLLSRSDLAALDQFTTLQTNHAEMAEQLQLIGLALKAFDFNQAMVQCDELIRKVSPLALRT